MPRLSRFLTAAGAAACAAALLAAPAALGASPDLVVSQVYAGGGNSGATFASDYVELFNRGSSSVDLSGWSVQYATAAGASWQVTGLAGTVPAGRFFLVQLASGGSAGAALPAPDATGTSNLAASGGKVALVHDTAALACGAAEGSCSAVGAIRDLVGYGSAVDFEGGAAAPALSATTAAVRAAGGCTDTDHNDADFAESNPAPHTSSAAAVTCSGNQPPAPSATAAATVSVDVGSSLSIALDHPTLSFGTVSPGDTPSPLSEHVVVTSTNAAGYTLGVHRSAFAPADLPLGISATAPAGATLGSGLGGGAVVGLPIPPATDLLLGTASAATPVGGATWQTSLGFTGPLPALPPGHYSSTVTFTVIAR
jgi:hypothetical protein